MRHVRHPGTLRIIGELVQKLRRKSVSTLKNAECPLKSMGLNTRIYLHLRGFHKNMFFSGHEDSIRNRKD
jgi:hypothetical protein